jgi:hypothetical protein
MASIYRWTDKDIAEALRLFHQATELDPNFGAAYGAAGWCSVRRNVNGWTPNSAHEIAEAARLARRVAQSGKDDAAALSFGGLAWAYVARSRGRRRADRSRACAQPRT